MMRNGEPPKTQREKAAIQELTNLAEESKTLMVAGVPRNLERMRKIAARGRVLLPMAGWEHRDDV